MGSEEDEMRFNMTFGGCRWDVDSVVAWRHSRNQGLPALPRLCQFALDAYRALGFVGPMRALGATGLKYCRGGLERYVQLCDGHLNNDKTTSNHVTLPWLYKLARHPRIVGAVASVLGTENVLLLSSCMFLKTTTKPILSLMVPQMWNDHLHF